MTVASATVTVLLLLPVSACGPRLVVPEKTKPLYQVRPATWFEELSDAARVSPDGRWGLYGSGPRRRLVDLRSGAGDVSALRGPFATVENVTFSANGQLVRLASSGGTRGWFAEASNTPLPIPPDAVPVWSRQGRGLAFFRATARSEGVTIDGRQVPFPGHLLALKWLPDEKTLAALTRADDYTAVLSTLEADTGQVREVAAGLDAEVFPGQFAVTRDGRHAILALASGGSPDAAARHDPMADRDLDLWAIDLSTGEKTVVVTQPGDDFAPNIIGDDLVWTHADVRPSVVVVPSAGGEAREVVERGELPYWSADGRQLGFTVGGWRLRDMALPLDAHVIDLNDRAVSTSAPRPLSTGFHEDFTPAWSPDGRWLAFHSHRSPTPVPAYLSPGSTDDVWMARTTDPRGTERRLTDFGHEAGMADWAPDGRRLAFVSYEKAKPETLQTWIVTIDPDTGARLGATRLALPLGIRSTETIAWSPDGATLAIESKTEDAERHALWLLTLASGQATRLTEHPTATFGGIDWTPDGKTVVYGALAAERMQVFALDIAGGAPRQLTSSEASVFLPQVSPDGRWIAATTMRHVRRILRRPLRLP